MAAKRQKLPHRIGAIVVLSSIGLLWTEIRDLRGRIFQAGTAKLEGEKRPNDVGKFEHCKALFDSRCERRELARAIWSNYLYAHYV